MQSARILIADDDAMLRLDLRTMLGELGHSVVGEADNGETACFLAERLNPDLTILDVEMPRKTGLEAAEFISKERYGAVILLTAYSDIPMIEQANRAGVLAYLVKPFRQQDMAPAIEIALSRYREMTALETALQSSQESIESGRTIRKAIRVLMDRFDITEQEAHRRLQAKSHSQSLTLRQIADAVLLTEETTARKNP